MKLKDLLFKNRNKSLEEAPIPVKSSTPKKNTTITNLKNLLVKAPLIASNTERGALESPDYDLEEIRAASLADSYIRQALLKQRYILFKAGYQFKSENEEALKYLKLRLNIMSYATQKPIDILFQEIGDDLITYSNAFLIKSRVDTIMPGIKTTSFLGLKPVGGYFRADPVTMSIDRDKNGKILYYVQNVNGEEKKFKASEVIHYYLDREADSAFGTPRIVSALEDVKLLRRIEGSIMVLIHRFSMPFFQVKVGLPQLGFQATDPEIDKVRNEVEGMSLDGMLVTNERTELKAIGAEGSALNAEGYLNYFEKRVFSALDVSAAQMGRDGSNQNADSMEEQSHNVLKHIQRMFSVFTQYGIINEILMEGGYNPILEETDTVEMVFNEINLDTKVKLENHEMLKFQSNMSTFDEMRQNLGLKPTTAFDKLYKNLIEVSAQKDIINTQSAANIKIAKNNQDFQLKLSKMNNSNNENDENNKDKKSENKKGVGIAGNGKNKSQASNKDIETRNKPENQYGKTSVKVKESYNNVINKKKNHLKVFSEIYNIYKKASNEINKKEDIELILSQIEKELIEKTIPYLDVYSIKAIRQCLKENKLTSMEFSEKIDKKYFEDEIEKCYRNLFSDINIKLKKKEFDKQNVVATLETMEYRIRFLLEYVLPKFYWYSYCICLKNIGFKKAIIDFDNSKDLENHDKNVDLASFTLNDIPPFHPFCDCKIKKERSV